MRRALLACVALAAGSLSGCFDFDADVRNYCPAPCDAGASRDSGGAVDGGGGQDAGNNPSTGQLTVTITPPAGATSPSVTVTGPFAFTQTLTSTSTLVVDAGTYTLSATPVSVASSPSIASTVYAPAISGSPALVTAGGAASATVAYAARPGSGHLWVIDEALQSIVGYSAAELAAGGTVAPDIGLGVSAAACSPYTIAVDVGGNLWVSCDGLGNSLWKLTPEQLTSSGPATPYAVISNAGGPNGTLCGATYSEPGSMAFDHAGNLWVVQYTNNAVARYDAASLIGDGGLGATPASVITSTTPGDFLNAHALTFDRSGNMWLVAAYSCSFGAGPGIMKIQAASLAGTGARAVTPTRYYSASLLFPVAMGFDPDGNFWFTDDSDRSFVKYTAAQVAAAPVDGGYRDLGAPYFRLTSANLSNPNVAVFDEHKDLWSVNLDRRNLAEFLASNIQNQGTQSLPADGVVSAPDGGTSGRYYLNMAFDPSAIIPPQ